MSILLQTLTLIVCVHFVVSHSCTTLTTFNAGLTAHVSGDEDRKSEIPDALAADGSDVICLQEYWFEADMQEMINQVKSVYPYHYSSLHYDVGYVRKPKHLYTWWERFTGFFDYPDSACDAGDVAHFTISILPCAIQEDCLSLIVSDPALGMHCLAQKCPDTLKDGGIGAECISCLLLAGSSLDSALSGCADVNPFRPHNELNPPGLVLLSKRPISNQKYQSYFPSAKMALQRGYIEADVKGIGKVLCTHLSSNLPIYLEYDLDYGNYEAQQRDEIVNLGTTFNDVDHILMGDLNTGTPVEDADPEKNLSGELPDNYQLLTDGYHYQNVYLEQDGRCTWCEGNSVAGTTSINVIDHILLMGDTFSSVTMMRTLDQIDPDINTPLSDHYGVRARMCKGSSL